MQPKAETAIPKGGYLKPYVRVPHTTRPCGYAGRTVFR